jgi:serpin B
MKKVIFSVLAAILVLSTVSCGEAAVQTVTKTETTTETVTKTQNESLTTKYGQYMKSDKSYDSSPDVSRTDMELLADGNNTFAYELYRQIIDGDSGNFFYSPYSISVALAMTYAGAEGETSEQMAEVMSFLLEDEELHEAFNKLSIELNSRDDVDSEYAKGFQLSVVNAIWGQEDFEFIPAFLDVLSENYDAGIRLLDFINETDESRVAINDWVSEQTNDRINDLLPEGSIDSLTRLVLTNAIYFNAAWLYQFDEENTADGTFYLPDGSKVTVPMMNQIESFRCCDGDGYVAVELPYDTGDLSMVIIMPDKGNFEEFESMLTSDSIEGILNNLSYKSIELTMPKFEMESEFSVKDALLAMGMTDAFSDAADFSGITDPTSLCIDDVLHKAFVSVDEEGTEAAAATAVIMKECAMPPTPEKVTIDSSFIFLIQDIQTGTTLFIGRVINPAV